MSAASPENRVDRMRGPFGALNANTDPASTPPNRLPNPPADIRRPDLGIIDLQMVGYDGRAGGSERLWNSTAKLRALTGSV
jgi:hypothetical protein